MTGLEPPGEEERADEAVAGVPGLDVEPEVPEADALEQLEPVAEEAAPPWPPAIAAEVPEADALEQARPEPYDDEELR
ncbi:MAG TPA: hypothetical protein VKV23_10505 [Acidimicrobiales bacterium]|nr:hypothetical protein [Acidimicrobiales bacterium]